MYDLHKLGWNSFQQLCLTIAREILGQNVESFLDSHDGGRDGAFAGTWIQQGQEDLEGEFVIQCKFTNRVNHNLTMSELYDEVAKAGRLVKEGRCDSYVLLTNAGISGNREVEIADMFKSKGVKHVRVYGSNWINQQIQESLRLRRLVPRVYGLGDLTQILDQRAYVQANAVLESMREDLAKVVVTEAYQQAVSALAEHGFVILIGEPASGKTTIASLLAMSAIDSWGVSVIKADDPSEFSQLWNPDEPTQCFWFDDAFGVTQYQDQKAAQWNSVIPKMRAALRGGTKLVMTSRDYIYKRASDDLKSSTFPLFYESQVVIDVHRLSGEEKRQILYNHMKLGKQPQSFKSMIKNHLEAVADHPRFIPEIARRLADPFFTANLTMTRHHILEFVDKREQLLEEILRGLDTESKAALALVFMRGGSLQIPIELHDAEIQALDRLGGTLNGCGDALLSMAGSLAQLLPSDDDQFWRFRHPTIGDAYGAILAHNPDHVGILVQGSNPERLLNQITCGDVGLQNATVVPRNLFRDVIAKLEPMVSVMVSVLVSSDDLFAAYAARDRLSGFLSNRCSKTFLAMFLQEYPKLLDAGVDIRLTQRLHEFDLLPSEHRERLAMSLRNDLLDCNDAKALDDDVRRLFTCDEFYDLIQTIKSDLLPNLSDIIQQWQDDWPQEEDPESWMSDRFDFLGALEEYFTDEQGAIWEVEGAKSDLAQWVSENAADEPDISAYEDYLSDVDLSESSHGDRSIFDDIDAPECEEKS